MKQLLLSTLFLFTLTAVSLGQSAVLTGKVIDKNGLSLPGATILVEDLEKGTVSDNSGSFLMTKLPNGKLKLKISYLGYQTKLIDAELSAEKTTEILINLEEGYVQGTEVVILGDRLRGQAKALNQQKNNMNITNVVAADQIGRFPDANVGDAMKRIPGITMQGDQGEARNVIVRGMAPQLNSVTLNGERIPSAEGDNRNVQLDLIPADMISMIEVNKAVTPDMEGDAIGGSVNLNTIAPSSGLRVSATAGSGLAFISKKPIANGSIIIGNRIANDKIGFVVSASGNYVDYGSHNVEGEWENEVESPITGEDIEVDPYLGEMDIRRYEVARFRRSAQANLDFKLNENHTLFVKGMYNWRDDWENRYRMRYRSIDPIFQDGTENITGWQGEIRKQTKGGINNDRSKNTRLEDQRVFFGSVAGEHLFGSLNMDWGATYSKASEDRPNERYVRYEMGTAIPFTTDFENSETPFIGAANASDVSADRFELDALEEENKTTSEEDFNVKLNFELPVELSGNDGSIKFGGRYRTKTKERANSFNEFSALTADYNSLSQVPNNDYSDPDYLAGSQYASGTFATPEFLGNLDLYNTALFENEDAPSEYLPVNYSATENVTAAYAMWTQDLGDKLQLLAGARLELTDIEYIGNETEEGENALPLNASNSYSNFLPGVHFKYNFNNNSNLRLAWTNTLARPNYYNLVPYRDVIPEDEEVYQGNSALEPTESMNVDLMAENYFESVGLVSAGIFYKQIDNFIYTQQLTDTQTGYDLFQPTNGGTANLTGFELAIQRQLDFLPGGLKGLGIYANYTYITSSATGVRNEDGDEREVNLPGTAPHMFNASLSYENEKFIARASLNYSHDYIDELGGNEFTDRYYDRQLFLDFNASYAFTPSFRFYLELNNITNQPLRYYQGDRARTMQVEYYNMRLQAGFKYDLFKK